MEDDLTDEDYVNISEECVKLLKDNPYNFSARQKLIQCGTILRNRILGITSDVKLYNTTKKK